MFDAFWRGDPYVAMVLFLLTAAVAVLFLYLSFERLNRWLEQRSESLLQDWARQQGFQLLKHERRLEPGPFPWLTTFAQTIYHVIVTDEQGRNRRGWVRCGRMLVGVLARKVEVRWDE